MKTRLDQEIPGKVIETFTILHFGWEMDNIGWITDAGEVYSTSHGGLHKLNISEVRNFLKETKESLSGLENALKVLEKNETSHTFNINNKEKLRFKYGK